MTLRMIHTADWQLGRPFGRFPDDLAARLRAARLEAIDRIAEHARSAGARHVLVAGDVWDQETPAERTLVQPLDRLARATDLLWWLLPGNHDPARPQGLWERIAAFGPPANVRLCTQPGPLQLEADAWLLPAPLATRRPTVDPSAVLDAMPTPAGALRVGLAHGSITSFAEDDAAAAAIAPDRARRAGLAYLALGDWHGRQAVDERTWYAGTPEPDRFPRNDPGWCLEVVVEGHAPPRVSPRPTARHRWRRARLAWVPGLGWSAVEALLADTEIPADRTLLALELEGTIGLAERSELALRLEAMRHRLAHLEVADAALTTVVEDGDLDLLGTESGLRRAATTLAERAVEDAAARRALDLLFAWSREP